MRTDWQTDMIGRGCSAAQGLIDAMGKSQRKQFPIEPSELRVHRDHFLRSMADESDRGCVLVGAAFLDEALEMLLRSKMLRDTSTVKNCVDSLFVGLGPLKSFWSKTQLCRSLGLLEEWEYQDLNRIRNLRNLFAHIYEGADFEDPRVIGLNQQLVAADKAVAYLPKNPPSAKRSASGARANNRIVAKKERTRFIISVSWLGARIHVRAGHQI